MLLLVLSFKISEYDDKTLDPRFMMEYKTIIDNKDIINEIYSNHEILQVKYKKNNDLESPDPLLEYSVLLIGEKNLRRQKIVLMRIKNLKQKVKNIIGNMRNF